MTEKRFKNCLIELDKAKQKVEKEKRTFVFEVKEFMRDKGIPVKLTFFGDMFALDIDFNINNVGDVPRKIPLDVLNDFCKEFDCDFEYTYCEGKRWFFNFNKVDMGY